MERHFYSKNSWRYPPKANTRTLPVVETNMSDPNIRTGRQTPAWLIEEYIKLRNKVNEIKAKHAEQLEPYATVMQTIESQLLDHLQHNDLGSIKGDSGTAYKQTITSVTVDNWDQVLRYIQENNTWDLLERRVVGGDVDLA